LRGFTGTSAGWSAPPCPALLRLLIGCSCGFFGLRGLHRRVGGLVGAALPGCCGC